ncbi:class E sortase [Streptomyces pinistramenti]|uniref:class E sortase n=1 Tax=Streptomyces pinistramenti TaxID=2884812 RepID=UPI001D07CD6A|nr:class E sortase [Streptomyces pinistramenti]MCB5909381.1 class E sortase [Streptomyces pinistramenti]
MTTTRPERDGRSQDPYDQPSPGYEAADPYGGDAAFEAAVGQLNDPLTDPLPGPAGPPAGTYGAGAADPLDGPDGSAGQQQGAAGRAGPGSERAGQAPGGQGSPWFRPHLQTPQPSGDATAPHGGEQPHGGGYPPKPRGAYGTGYEPHSVHGDPISVPPAADPFSGGEPAAPRPAAARPSRSAAVPSPASSPVPSSRPGPGLDESTMALRQAEEPAATGGQSAAGGDGDGVSRETNSALSRSVSRETDPAPGGRAARRKAAQQAAKRGGKRGKHGGAAAAPAAAEPPPAPTSRLEARRAARAAKDSLGLIASRAVGEVFITLGVLMLLFVTYQLWWTNVLANEEAGGAASTLQHTWDEGGEEKKTLTPGERFAIMYIPKLDVKAPVAEGIDKHTVLDRGMVGHYDKSSGIKTAMPWDKKGNFSVAAHRNTHGEPFRYINKLTPGDKIVVETQSTYYTYQMESILPQTSPQNVSVIQPVPQASGFKGPGRYITLTTCTPEFTSTYRMIVWGKMVDERPRSKGEPAALTG